MAQKWIDKIEKNNEEYDIYREGFEIGTNESGNYTLSLSNTPPVYNITDQVPYNFRPSGGDFNIGKKELDELVGGTVAWNQKMDANLASWRKIRVSVQSDNNITKITSTSSAAVTKYVRTPVVANHKLLFLVAKVSSSLSDGNISYGIYKGETGTDYTVRKSLTKTGYVAELFNVDVSSIVTNPHFALNYSTTVNNGDFVSLTNPRLFDLTQMFGATIADYIYSLEQATAGAGVAYFRNLFPKSYYPYNPGGLISVKTSAHKMVGFNQWDEEWEVGSIDSTGVDENSDVSLRSKNMIKVVHNITYYEKSPSNISIFYYDVDKNFISSSIDLNNQTFVIPSNAHYIKFVATDYIQNYSTYNNDICINISYDGSNDGKYEPYTEHTYNLPNVELRGIFKLDSNNKLYCDGDIEKGDGTITRKYGIVDLGTLNWEYITSRTVPYFRTSISDMKNNSSSSAIGNILCVKYSTSMVDAVGASGYDKIVAQGNANNRVYVQDTSYTDAAAFKTAMSGVYLVYELEIPTTEKTNFFTNPQTVYNQGTEEYIDNREVAIPVGHNTKYDEPWEEIKN